MSLTITPPLDSKFDHLGSSSSSSHDLTSTKRIPTVFSIPNPSSAMTSSHRGLPPPAAMTLPDPTRPPTSASHNFAHLPAPPAQWHDAEDSMREWLAAKMEDDKRKQEEAKLEQRRIEERMLREAYSSPVPPHLIPVIFAGLSGGPLATASLDMAQQHLAQIQQQAVQHQQYMSQPQTSPDIRHTQNQQIIAQPLYMPAQTPLQQGSQAAPGQQMLPSQSQHASVYPSPAYTSPKSRNKTLYAAPPQYGPHSAVPRGASSVVSLSRLTTNEPLQTAPSSYAQQQEQSSPGEIQNSGLVFNHWTPAAINKGTDSNKPSPSIPSHVANSNHTDSPRKRKAQGGHERNPPPSSQPQPPTSNPQAASPAFSATSSGSTKSQRTSTHDRRPSKESQTRAGYDPIGRSNRGSKKENSRSDASGSDRSGPVSRPATPKDTPDSTHLGKREA